MMTSPATRIRRAPARTRRAAPSTPFGLARALSPQVPGSRVFLGVTVARLILVAPIAFLGSPLIATGALATFIVWDIWDGKVARRYTVDSPLRRMADAYTDRTFILVVVGALAVRDHRWILAFTLLLIRDVAMWAGLQAIYTRTGACLLGGRPSKHTAIMWAAWAFATFWTGFNAATVALACAWVVMKYAVAANSMLSARGVACDPPRVLVVERWGTRFGAPGPV